MSNLKTKNKNEQGIGLIEVIAALGLALVVLTSLLSLSIFTLRASFKSKIKLKSSSIANQQIELVRARRDTSGSWDNFIVGEGLNAGMDDCTAVSTCHIAVTVSDFTVSNSGTGIASGANSSDPEYIGYYFTAKNLSGGTPTITDDVVRITVIVEWNDGGTLKQNQIVTDLSRWKLNT